ncbi:MAG: alpha-1,2-fucosyltransferase [Prevotella sp.]|nr:alpha-1,2-fucosyltransferase [Prevotella sp.]
MKIVHIIGGLGNQMFQYALLVALREHFGQPILADISSFNGYKLHNGFELTNIFGISPVLATKQDIRKLTWYAPTYKIQRILRQILPQKKTECIESKKGDYVEDMFTNQGDRYYEGYWQTYKYFDKYYDIICREFTFPENKLSEQNKNLACRIKNDPILWVSVHVRRGDYLGNKRFGNICDANYYISAIEKIKQLRGNKKLHFLILSNGIAWCRDNLQMALTDSPHEFVDWNTGVDSYVDIYLMTLCSSNIIANSSFSWWGGYLNRNSQKIVIAPRKWTNDIVAVKRQLPDWILV